MTLSSNTRRWCAALALLTVTLFFTGCKKKHRKAASAENTSDFAAQIESVTSSPKLDMLRWPDYSDYQPIVKGFYNDRDSELAWIRDGKPTKAATAMLEQLSNASLKGLDPEDYDASRWAGRVQQIEAIHSKKDESAAAQNTVAQFDVALTVDAVRYLSDVHLGRVNPQTLNFDIDVPAKRKGFDVATLLNDKAVDASADEITSLVASVEPQNPMYTTLEQALPHYIELAKQETASPVPSLPALSAGAKSIAVGGTYGGLAPMLQRLQMDGDAPAPETNDGAKDTAHVAATTTYTSEMADAVKRFQARHGLADDGKLGQSTIDAMNVTMAQNVQKIDDALERWRWLPDNYMQPRVLANLPEFMVRTYEPDHTLAFKMRVVVGAAKGEHDTPVFVRLMRYVVFRPYWNLPPSIVKKEIMPHIARSGLGYLASHDYEVYNNKGDVVTGYTAADLEHSRYSIRQKPGPKNSLGLVKFLFPNEYDVYMHSTPELNLFGLARRDKSHGCVRLQHADQMAVWVMGNNVSSTWDAAKVNTAMNGTDNNKTYNLKNPLPVVITYMTAMADEDGSVHFFNDMYGYDKELEAALAKGRPYPQGTAKINPHLVPGETE